MPSLREITTTGLKNPDGSAYTGNVTFQILKIFAESSGTAVPSTSAFTMTSGGLFPTSSSILAPDGSGAIEYYIEIVGLNSAFRNSVAAGATPISFEELVITATSSGTPNELQALIDIERSERIAADTTLQTNINTVQTNLDNKDHGTLVGLADNDHPQYALIASSNTFTATQTIQNTTSGQLSLSAQSVGANNAPGNSIEVRHTANGTAQTGYGTNIIVFLEVDSGAEVQAFIVRPTLTDASAAGVKSQLELVGIRNNAEYTLIRLDPFPSDDQTNLFVRHGATNTLKRVLSGAADSAGVGFRQLRVSN